MMISRTAIPKRSVVLLSRRLYSSNFSGSEGATASSKGSFSDKEKAIENQWARQHDAEKIKALHDALEQQKQVTESLQKDLNELKKTVGKK
ncbi:hypothetical protein BJV82DRAFT_599711 [Fennellomyces sp. T-0311]|nr:hypothetical protein BJV82DRAFT_599711 [Fennellomyces sp. T-0311]